MTARHLDIITAIHPDSTQHLDTTAQSVQATRRRIRQDGRNLTWHIVVDGTWQGPPPSGCDRTIILGRHCGVSAARNSALAETEGDIVMPLDGDDILHPEGVARALEILENDPSAHWVGGSATILRERHVETPPPGTPRVTRDFGPKNDLRWPAGTLGYPTDGPWPFHPNVIVARTTAVLDVGGWHATPVAEDKGLSARLGARYDGIQTPEALITYRLWENQTVIKEGHTQLEHLSNRLNLRILNASAHHPTRTTDRTTRNAP